MSTQRREPSGADSVEGAAGNAATVGVAKRGAITLLGTVIGGGLMFANEILAARFLGLPLYGCYALAIVFARIGEVLSMAGVGIGVLHFIPVYRSRQDQPRLVGAILLALTLPLVAGAILITAMWWAAPILATRVIHDPQALPYFRWFACSIPLLGLSEICGRVTRGFGHAIYHVVIRDVIPRLVYLVALSLLFLLDADRLWIAAAFAAGYLLASLAGVASVILITGGDLWHTAPRIPFREMSRYSFPSFVTLVLSLVMGAIEYLMIGILRTSSEAGLFRGALQFASVLQIIIHAFAASTVHLYPVLVEQGRQAELRQVYGLATRSVNMLAAPLSVLIALNRVDLLQLLGSEFSAAATTLSVLLLSNLIRSCLGISPYILLVTGRQFLEMLNSIVGIGLSIVFHLWLIPIYGILGAALATCLTSVALALIRTWQMRTQYGLATFSLETMRPLWISVATGLAIWAVTRALGVADGSGWMSLLVRFPLSALILAVAIRLGLGAQDRGDTAD